MSVLCSNTGKVNSEWCSKWAIQLATISRTTIYIQYDKSDLSGDCGWYVNMQMLTFSFCLCMHIKCTNRLDGRLVDVVKANRFSEMHWNYLFLNTKLYRNIQRLTHHLGQGRDLTGLAIFSQDLYCRCRLVSHISRQYKMSIYTHTHTHTFSLNKKRWVKLQVSKIYVQADTRWIT